MTDLTADEILAAIDRALNKVSAKLARETRGTDNVRTTPSQAKSRQGSREAFLSFLDDAGDEAPGEGDVVEKPSAG